MASNALRLRRALVFTSALISRSTTSASSTVTVCRSPIFRFPFSSPPPPPSTTNSLPVIGSRCVHSTSLSLSASRSFNHGDDQIDENTILFEGCDYKHWLITMDFPKDPRPSPEEMVETYVQTLAKVFGSVEEAKKRMYACSTTTYTGFQAEMDEETANKFEGMPGVVFVLPDSYIDPVNKEYGGDKYINGTIIPRPPPVQYGRQRRPRGPPQNPQGYPEQGRMQRDGPNFTPQQNFQQQSCGPPRPNFPSQQNYPQRENHGPMHNNPPQQNFAPSQNYPPQRENHGPMHNNPQQQNFAPSQNYPPQRENRGPMHNNPPQQNFAPSQNYPPQQNYAPPQQNFAPPRQGERMGPTLPYNRGSGYPSGNQRDYEGRQNFAPPSSSGGGAQYGGQGGRGSYRQNQTEHFENGTGGSYVQGTNSEYGQGYAAHGENRHFNPPHGEQDIGGQNQQRNYPSMGRD